jgi:hypothetical protein
MHIWEWKTISSHALHQLDIKILHKHVNINCGLSQNFKHHRNVDRHFKIWRRKTVQTEGLSEIWNIAL